MKFWYPHEGLDPESMSARGEEVWSPHPYRPHVFVSNLGQVYLRGRKKEPYATLGYLRVTLHRDCRPYVHRLVLETFSGSARGRARRRSEDRSDNRLCNLYWG